MLSFYDSYFSGVNYISATTQLVSQLLPQKHARALNLKYHLYGGGEEFTRTLSVWVPTHVHSSLWIWNAYTS